MRDAVDLGMIGLQIEHADAPLGALDFGDLSKHTADAVFREVGACPDVPESPVLASIKGTTNEPFYVPDVFGFLNKKQGNYLRK